MNLTSKSCNFCHYGLRGINSWMWVFVLERFVLERTRTHHAYICTLLRNGAARHRSKTGEIQKLRQLHFKRFWHNGHFISLLGFSFHRSPVLQRMQYVNSLITSAPYWINSTYTESISQSVSILGKRMISLIQTTQGPVFPREPGEKFSHQH